MSAMRNYDDYGGLNLSASNMMGGFLVFLGAGVLIWVVVSLYQLFSSSSTFLVLDGIIPMEMVISETSGGRLLLPREILIFGVPIWALSAATKIGLTLLRSGLQYVDKPSKRN
ncbi:MAG: hypothetical protein JXA13_11975 [Anaerolineales bacterium]|nr:hypothetical protein [Anaerolineales bacterium]